MLIYSAAPLIQICIFVNVLDIVETKQKNLIRVGLPNFDFLCLFRLRMSCSFPLQLKVFIQS